jgi:hypothetical protein
MHKIETSVKALEGARVNVLNYRTRPDRWEPGTVESVKIKVYADGRTSNSYRVQLDRQSANSNLVFLTVGDDRIENAATAV